MEITLNKAVIHEIIKEQHKNPFPLNPVKEVLPVDNEIVIRLIKSVLSLYGKKNNSAQYGVFKTRKNAGKYPDEYKKYVALQSPSDSQFLLMSEVALGELHRLAKQNQASSGGYILVADLETDNFRYVLVSMLKKKGGIRLNKKLIPEELEQIDLNTIHQAARINCDKFNEFLSANEEERKELNYLSFVTPSANKAATGYFVEALGCSKGTASAKATDTLITQSVGFFRSKPTLKDKRIEFKDELMRYLSDCAEKPKSAKLSEVDAIARSYFPSDIEGNADSLSEELYEHLNNDRNGVPPEFPVNSGTLKKHTHVKYKSDNWQLLFDKDALGISENSEVQYIKDSKKLIISDLPADLRNTIEDVLRDKGVKL